MSPTMGFGLLTFAPALVLAVAIWRCVRPFDLLQSWLIAVTLVTFLAYGYDKAAASARRARVPEKVLLALALAGGTVGAWAGMRFFRHKTAKGRFQFKFLCIVIVQVLLIVAIYAVSRRLS